MLPAFVPVDTRHKGHKAVKKMTDKMLRKLSHNISQDVTQFTSVVRYKILHKILCKMHLLHLVGSQQPLCVRGSVVRYACCVVLVQQTVDGPHLLILCFGRRILD
jgi:hypothetical protein